MADANLGGTAEDHINPTYDADEDGTVDQAADADTVDGKHASDLGGEPNKPGWVEDANSPINGSTALSHTITLSQTYDRVMVQIQAIESSALQEVGIRINNNSNSDYNYTTTDGTYVTGETYFKVAKLSSGETVTGTFEIDTSGSTAVIRGPIGQGASSNTLTAGQITDTPIDKISLEGLSNNITAKARVFGWNGGV